MFKNTSLALVAATMLVTTTYAQPVDDYGRDLNAHERLGGHTVAKHVGKGYQYLRNRCSSERGARKMTSYRSKSQAEGVIADMIKDNKSRIDNFNSGKINIYEQNGWWYDYWYGYGYGINCTKLNKTKRVCARSNRRGRCLSYKTVKIDEIKKLYSAQSTLKKNSSNWYILTSYPK